VGYLRVAGLVKASRPVGFRSPTSDEWEYACSAGSRTLWRWGNDWPLDAYPTHLIHDENRTWDLNLCPNAFGLRIAFNDYEDELCEDGIKRGGDGGSSCCGGAGYLCAWITLASAYYDNYEDYESCLSAEPHDGSRRVFPLK
jgi:hypothetical protein